jgi:hypothetical protein
LTRYAPYNPAKVTAHLTGDLGQPRYPHRMDEEVSVSVDQVAGDEEWASRTVRSVALAESVSKLLLIGAGLALLFGAVGAAATYVALSPDTGLGDLSADSDTWTLTISHVTSILLSSLLPAGLLAAAGVALRLQVARFNAEVLGD